MEFGENISMNFLTISLYFYIPRASLKIDFYSHKRYSDYKMIIKWCENDEESLKS